MMFEANLHYLCMNIGTDLSAEVDSSNKKRWHVAFATIYCSRAFKNKASTKSSLAKLVKDKSVDKLANLGGVQGVAASLKSDATNGISGDPEDVARRHEAFGSNTYRKPPTKSFFIFVWESFKDPTIIILLLCAALSLGFGIKEHGPKEGWYDGGSIFVAVFLVTAVSSISIFGGVQVVHGNHRNNVGSPSGDGGVSQEVCKHREVELGSMGYLHWICSCIMANWLA
ncbi:Calcium-transporting ATPase 12, plasma membrane-type [Capsicum baccatum]|uniref:Calcium-transporting ATPase 12, plasma membrane-type n=1 Tax=Capsicum baccatum TaxID=33114 RepID=A0A2G2V0I5_CAPBA|nr:Calcium-transporting ATPase 12, plasma membrane-type [Capsicum baccatum]